ncbi:MAG: hypothetical protein JWM95_4920 [Gemmatimonadetes bacterium]|nr:hypothetical protein [Gemmatimonadota bacterium]
MTALVAWIAAVERSGTPAPIIAGLTHYQFVTGPKGRLGSNFHALRRGIACV